MRFFNLTLLAFFLLVLLFLPPVWAGDKDFYLDEAKVYYEIDPDGLVSVVNEITYRFSGSFSRAWLDIPTGEYEILDAQVSEVAEGKAQPYTRVENPRGRPPGTYTFTRDAKRYTITWFYRAENETKTFRIEYKIYRGIKVYDDVADFHWKVWGGEWERGLPKLWLEVLLPSRIQDPNEVNYWLHPSIKGEISISKDHQKVIAYGEDIPAKQWVEVRIVFPRYYLQKDLDPERVILLKESGRDKILQRAEPQSQGEEEEELSALEVFVGWTGLLSGLSLLGVGIGYLWMVTRRHRDPEIEGVFCEEQPPEDIPPAWVEMLIKKSSSISPDAVVASILELAEKGYLKIQEEEVKSKGLFGRWSRDRSDFKIILTDKPEDPDLSRDTKFLLDWLKSQGKEFYLSDIGREELKDLKDTLEPMAAEAVYEGKKWIDREGELIIGKTVKLWLLIGAISILLGILLASLGLFVGGVMLLFIGPPALINAGIAALFKSKARRYSHQGKVLALRRRAYGDYLAQLFLEPRIPDYPSDYWWRAVKYGLVLGRSREALVAGGRGHFYLEDICFSPLSPGKDPLSILDSFSSAFRASVDSAYTSPSSDSFDVGGDGGGRGGGGAD